MECGVPYPFRIVDKNAKRDKSDLHSLYCPVVKELLRTGLKIRHILADAKERKRLMGLSSVTAKFACECCYAICNRVKVGNKCKISFPW